MHSASFAISLREPWALIGSANAPQILDVRQELSQVPIAFLRGFMVYDALFAYLRFAFAERHNWPAKAA